MKCSNALGPIHSHPDKFLINRPLLVTSARFNTLLRTRMDFFSPLNSTQFPQVAPFLCHAQPLKTCVCQTTFGSVRGNTLIATLTSSPSTHPITSTFANTTTSKPVVRPCDHNNSCCWSILNSSKSSFFLPSTTRFVSFPINLN